MERFHRYYSLHRILSSRRLPVPRAVIERELECSRATCPRQSVFPACGTLRSLPVGFAAEEGRAGGGADDGEGGRLHAQDVLLIRFAGRKLGVPLSQLDAPQAGPETREVVED